MGFAFFCLRGFVIACLGFFFVVVQCFAVGFLSEWKHDIFREAVYASYGCNPQYLKLKSNTDLQRENSKIVSGDLTFKISVVRNLARLIKNLGERQKRTQKG